MDMSGYYLNLSYLSDMSDRCHLYGYGYISATTVQQALRGGACVGWL